MRRVHPSRGGDPVPPTAKSVIGLTLIELLVAIAILGILAALAAPTMSGFIASQRLRAMAADLSLAIQKARSEAIKQNVSVTLSPLRTDWGGGWQILDPVAPGTSPAIDTWTAKGSVTVATNPGSLGQVVFNANGRVATATAISFVFTDLATSDARCVSVDPSGRPYSQQGLAC